MVLVSSCATPGVKTTVKPTECRVPPFPADPVGLVIENCEIGEDTWVCMTQESAAAIGLWVRDVIRYYEAVKGCPNVVETPE